ncbi:MAG: hypothetical protein ACYDG6_04805 [Thermincolia bacterium]
MPPAKRCRMAFRLSRHEDTLPVFVSLLQDNGYHVLTEYNQREKATVHAYFHAKNSNEFTYHEAQLTWIAEIVKNAYFF